MSVKERLDFLSWLFQCGLSQYMSVASREFPLKRGEIVDKPLGSPKPQRHHPSITRRNSCATTTRSRKGKAWDSEEIKLLIQLKEQNFSGSAITRAFAEQFLGRSKGSIQVYWSTSLKHLH
ncbi:hypothetical protein BGW36DRAFT_357886 [Talaromyces proteolyticus]|uniref:Uncharacterized protein n=1 Tax=Talaromyces proteolyticus TaxID=1131652 RepID=A0AAD4KXJ4_9EURO|nr:uncharacterized protein BGW36DRAFT_357886 [Talaromyces proteolyticus]KAH8698346.1 hypothetical protein BGW36DRAFT_357886 [Talaromyces proteolyticus]